MQILADILHTELEVVTGKATPGYGAALLAAMADGVLKQRSCDQQGEVYTAQYGAVQAYHRQYEKYKRMYSALKQIMQE